MAEPPILPAGGVASYVTLSDTHAERLPAMSRNWTKIRFFPSPPAEIPTLSIDAYFFHATEAVSAAIPIRMLSASDEVTTRRGAAFAVKPLLSMMVMPPDGPAAS